MPYYVKEKKNNYILEKSCIYAVKFCCCNIFETCKLLPDFFFLWNHTFNLIMYHLNEIVLEALS